MDPYERSKLGDAVVAESFASGSVIIQQGAMGNTFYMVSEGTAKAVMKGADGVDKEVM